MRNKSAVTSEPQKIVRGLNARREKLPENNSVKPANRKTKDVELNWNTNNAAVTRKLSGPIEIGKQEMMCKDPRAATRNGLLI